MTLANLIKKFNSFKITGAIHLFNPFAPSRRKLLFPCLAIFLALLCAGCQESGLVGTKMPGNSLGVTTDTFEVAGTQSISLESVAGRRMYLSAGQFQDPLFGDIKVTDLLLPALVSYDSSYTFDQKSSLKLKLYIHTKSVYGDTTSREKFKLLPINEIWRGNQRKIHESLRLASGSAVGTFTAGRQDSMVIPISNGFWQEYLTYYRSTDSTRTTDYRDQFHGLAIVPQNSGKIVTINAVKSHFLVTGAKHQTDSTTTRDTLKLGFKDWAYTLNRTNASQPDSGSTKIINTLENVLQLKVHLSTDDINPKNVSKAELVIYRNSQKLKTSLSGKGPNLTRPASDTLFLYRAGGDKDELLKTLDPVNSSRVPRIPAVYNEDDNAYHFLLTANLSWIINSNSNLSLYLVPNVNNGIIREGLLFNNRASDVLQPKIIVTHTNTK